MQIALALYPNFTMLDIIGPFQVLADVPGHEVVFVAAEAGPVVDHTGRAALIATKSFADVPSRTSSSCPADCVTPRSKPNSSSGCAPCTRRRPGRRASAPARSTSPPPGILDGLDATTHWARKRALEKLGRPLHDRARRRTRARSSPRPVSRAASTWPSSCSIACTDPRWRR